MWAEGEVRHTFSVHNLQWLYEFVKKQAEGGGAGGGRSGDGGDSKSKV